MTRTPRPTPRQLAGRRRPLTCRPLPAPVLADLDARYRREIDAAYAQRRTA
jgi:hypothetical protein